MFRDKSNDLEDASLEELYAEVLGPGETDDILVQFDDGTRMFSVEFVDFEDFQGFNVAGPLPRDVDPEELIADVDLDASDSGSAFVLFESTADDAPAAVSELKEVATATDVTMDDIAFARRRNIEHGGLLGWLGKKVNQKLNPHK